MKQLALIVTILLCDISRASAAEPQITGNQIAQSCRAYLKQPQTVSACSALLRGVFEGHLQGAIAYGLLHNITQFSDLPFVWCPSDKSTVSDVQLVNVYTKYVEQRPQVADRSAANIAATAFMIAWPCQK